MKNKQENKMKNGHKHGLRNKMSDHRKNIQEKHRHFHKNTKSPEQKKFTENKLIGPINVNLKGVGFFDMPDQKRKKEESFEIRPENLNGAFNGDIVEIKVTGRKILGKIQAEVKRVIKRTKTQFVGTILGTFKEAGPAYLIPDDKRMYKTIILPKVKPRSPAEGKKVLVEIIDWSNNNQNLIGSVIYVIGKPGKNDTEMESIVYEKGFAVNFSPEVLEAAEKEKDDYKKNFEAEASLRRDMRQVTTFTIDPVDAKDFDDAISFKELGENLYEIGVHIADVSHFVRPDSVLDKEAEKRGLSVYLVDRTIPMLPEILSNDLCSLNPNEDKFTFSAIFKLNKNGDVLDEWFGRTVIHSDKRFSYEEAHDVISGKNPGPFREELLTLNKIAQRLEKKKYAGGAINFENEEVRFELDQNGKPLRVYKKERLETHKLVEEYMLLANRAVAKFIFMSQNEKQTVKTRGKQSVYRIHGKPDPERIMELAVFLKALGFELKNKDGEVTSRDINNLLKEVSGTPNEELIKTAAIRSMAKAVYSTKNIGHFGLAFKYYTHFTSPIRRYPDLLVHRFLERELSGGHIEQNEYQKFESLCLASSELEKRAADAERTSIKYKQVEYMSEHLGETFKGTITGLTSWGMYVEEKETKCEGLIHIKKLGNDFFVLDEKNYSIYGERTKKTYRLGDSIEFKVLSFDLEKKTLDYGIV